MALAARISIATLGVSDLARSTKFYQALGWKLAEGSSSEIIFFRTAGGVLALYPFDLLAKDAALPAVRTTGFGGMTLAQRRASRRRAAGARRGEGRRCNNSQTRGQGGLGRSVGILRRPGRLSLGSCVGAEV